MAPAGTDRASKTKVVLTEQFRQGEELARRRASKLVLWKPWNGFVQSLVEDGDLQIRG